MYPWQGQAIRHLPEGPFNPYDFSRAGLADNNRWNTRGEPTLYLACDAAIALAEWARHLHTERSPELARLARRRAVYRFQLNLTQVLDLRSPEVWTALSLTGAPRCFLDKSIARACAQFIRKTTPATAFLAPSVAMLDQLERWVLVVFLEKLGEDIHQYLPSVEPAGYFSISS